MRLGQRVAMVNFMMIFRFKERVRVEFRGLHAGLIEQPHHEVIPEAYKRLEIRRGQKPSNLLLIEIGDMLRFCPVRLWQCLRVIAGDDSPGECPAVKRSQGRQIAIERACADNVAPGANPTQQSLTGRLKRVSGMLSKATKRGQVIRASRRRTTSIN